MSGPRTEAIPNTAPTKALVLSPLGRSKQISDHDERHREDAAAAGPLNASEQDELGHPVPKKREVTELTRKPTKKRAAEKEPNRPERHMLPGVRVRELPVHERQRRRRQQIRGGHPCIAIDPLEILNHPRQRRRDDGLVNRRQKQCHENGEVDDRSIPVGDRDMARSGRRFSHGTGSKDRST